MQSSTLKCCAASLLLLTPIFSQAQNEGYAEPDSLLFKDGSTRAGVIVKNTADAIFLEECYQVSEFPKSDIVRIFDGADTGMEFTDAGKKGDLPSWRVMVNDIRNNDRHCFHNMHTNLNNHSDWHNTDRHHNDNVNNNMQNSNDMSNNDLP